MAVRVNISIAHTRNGEMKNTGFLVVGNNGRPGGADVVTIGPTTLAALRARGLAASIEPVMADSPLPRCWAQIPCQTSPGNVSDLPTFVCL